MTNDLARMDDRELETVSRGDWLTPEKVETIKRLFCKGADADEFEMFVEVCKRTGLSPFMRQIYGVMRFDKKAGRDVMTIQVGIDGFRLLADRSGRYVPGRASEFTFETGAKHPISATAYVKKLVAGEWHEVSATVYWDEFAEDSHFWRKMPRQMLGKVAESHALRRAFPAELSGVYTPEEMAQADNPLPNARPVRVDEQTGEILEQPAPAALPPYAKRAVPEELAYFCAVCKAPLTDGQSKVSIKAYDRPLCVLHQRAEHGPHADMPSAQMDAAKRAASQRAKEQAAPEPSERDRAKLEYGKRAFEAQQLGVKVPAIPREATAEQIRETLAVVDAMIEDAETERAAAAQGEAA